jgi:hypothetical protein
MKKIMATAAALLASIQFAQADLNIQWYFGFGVFNTGESDLVSGPGLLSVNTSGSTILQLIYAGLDDVVAPVDPSNSGNGYVGAGDTVLQSIPVTTGVNGYDDYVYKGPGAPYTDVAWTDYGGLAYIRVFYDATPAGGEAYYDSPTFAIVNSVDSTPANSQTIFGESGSNIAPSQGVALDQTIVPEPSAIALAGIGAWVVALRRRRQA